MVNIIVGSFIIIVIIFSAWAHADPTVTRQNRPNVLRCCVYKPISPKVAQAIRVSIRALIGTFNRL